MMRLLSRTFRSLKRPNPSTNSPKPPSSQSQGSSSSVSRISLSSSSNSRTWCVYLILSTNTPIKTYVGVTTNFPRRGEPSAYASEERCNILKSLKQHNGELKGGAKASRAGRPWVSACIIRGFKNQNEACVFESKWKISSRKLPRKRKNNEIAKHADEKSLLLLQHRQSALNRVKGLLDCSHLEIDWHMNPF